MSPERKRQLYWLFLTFVALLLVQSFVKDANAPEKISYSSFVSLLDAKEVASVEIRATEVRATKEDGSKVVVQRIPGIEGNDLVERLTRDNVEFSGYHDQTSWWQGLLVAWVLPLGLIFLLYSIFAKRMSGKGGALSFGNSDAKIYDRSKGERVTFADVAGVDEAEDELREVVDFLKSPEKYQSLGAHIPRGVLLVGPPGSGKTLLARAVAGEAQVPFFSMSGSEFVEMFVGVGASRMRSLFEQAKTRAPCIVFLDELDAIGKSRGGLGVMATNDEREQTLNQLLVEMDGFENDTGVIVMAATNRPETLDPALVRAGRFDRQVLVDAPDLHGRQKILEIHCRQILLHESVDLAVMARRTPGMSGADLANVVNEAALAAARRASKMVSEEDFETAIDRIQMGLRKTGQVMSETERHRVAYHEGGHALVAMSLEHTDPVHKVTIVPRSIGALGFTLQLPTEDRYLMTKEELLDRVCVMLAGRAAEQLVCKDVSTGAKNDLERATETARQMVCRYGMSDLGGQTFGVARDLRFLGKSMATPDERNYSEETAQRIDAAVSELLAAQQRRAGTILAKREPVLEALATRLLEEETLDAAELAEITADVTKGSAPASTSQSEQG